MQEMVMTWIETLLTVDGKGKNAKNSALKKLLLFACITGTIMGFCIGKLI